MYGDNDPDMEQLHATGDDLATERITADEAYKRFIGAGCLPFGARFHVRRSQAPSDLAPLFDLHSGRASLAQRRIALDGSRIDVEAPDPFLAVFTPRQNSGSFRRSRRFSPQRAMSGFRTANRGIMTLVWWAAVGSLAVPIVGALIHTRVMPWRRHAQFVSSWTWGASSGLMLGTVLGAWPLVLTYGASLMLADLAGVVTLEVRKRAARRALAECHPCCRCRKCTQPIGDP